MTYRKGLEKIRCIRSCCYEKGVEIITFIPEAVPFIQELFTRCPRKKSLSFGIL